MARGGKFGWVLGMVLGTVFGVLFAPQSGKNLRSRIKSDRKKGKLGFAPLQDDIKKLGLELAEIAKDLYESGSVQEVIEKGRKKMKELSHDFVDEVGDFHYSRIKPLQREVKEKVSFVKREIRRGKQKVKRTVRAGKKGFKAVKAELKKQK